MSRKNLLILGFALLGNLLSALAKEPFTKLIKSDIIDPLGLKNTGILIVLPHSRRGDMIADANPALLASPYLQSFAPCPAEECLSDFGYGDDRE